MVTGIALVLLRSIAGSRIVSHHNFTHSGTAMEAQSVYIQLKNLLDGNNGVKMYLHSLDLTRNSCEKCNCWCSLFICVYPVQM